MIIENITQAIGGTPTVKLNHIGRELECDLYGKCEFLNAGGSLKDRIGSRMIIEAQKSGRIKPGDTLIEPTSGNTGIGMALTAAALGYKLIITMPEKMSQEKQVVLEALGAEIVRTPTGAAHDSPNSEANVAKRLQQEIPGSHILDQYANPDNPDAHYYGTAQELLDDFGTDIAMVVIGVGTGGTITGVARKLKEVIPDVKIVGIDPKGSILGGGDEVFTYMVEGIGYDFYPDVLDNDVVDQYVKTEDKESFLTARRLISEEGLLVGGSSGAVVWGALQAAKSLTKGQKCIAILPDNIRNYLSKFVSDKWMEENGFTDG